VYYSKDDIGHPLAVRDETHVKILAFFKTFVKTSAFLFFCFYPTLYK